MRYTYSRTSGLPKMSDTLCVDIETGKLDDSGLLHPVHNKIRSVQIHDPASNDTHVLIENFGRVKDVLAGKKWIGHNLHFDIMFLWHYYRILPGDVHDTMIAEGLIHAGLPTKPQMSLQAITSKYLGKWRRKDVRMQWANNKRITAEMLDYAAEDVTDLFQIHQRQMYELTKTQPAIHVYNLEMRICKWVALMSVCGIRIDTKKWMARYEKEVEALHNIDLDLTKLLGGVQRKTIFGGTAVQVNFNSPKQVKKAFSENDIQLDSMDKGVLRDLIPTYQGRQKKLLELLLSRSDHKASVSTYGEKWLRHVSPETGKAYGSFFQTYVETGRFSGRSPNFTNIPKHGSDSRLAEFRTFFIVSGPNMAMVRADYGQQEARINAFLSQDPRLLEAFLKNIDVYIMVARYMFEDKTIIKGDPRRQIAKAIVLGLTYGMGMATLAYTLNCQIDEAKGYRERFIRQFPKVFENNQLTIARTERLGYGETVIGRRRHLDQLDGGFTGQASNMPIQGTAADMLKLAILIICEKLNWEKQQMVNAVHDELLFHCHIDWLVQTAQLVHEGMMEAANLMVKVPFTVDVDAGKNWSDKSYNDFIKNDKGVYVWQK